MATLTAIGPYDIGDVARLTLAVTAAGVPADPTAVVLTVYQPDSTSVIYSGAQIVKDSVGSYHCDIPVTQAGQVKFRWTGSGVNSTVEESSFLVRSLGPYPPFGPIAPSGGYEPAGSVALEATARANADNLLIPLTQKAAASGVATLDAAGLVPTTQMPPLSITDSFVVASQAAMLALTAQRGDVAVRTDLSQTFILAAEPATVLANWLLLATPVNNVLSVDGLTGTVVLPGDGAVGTATKRTLGAGALQAAAGADLAAETTNRTAADVAHAQSASAHIGTYVPIGGTLTLAAADPYALKIYQPAGATNLKFGLYLTDEAANAGRLLEIYHYGAGDAQSYGLDIHNFVGAQSALVVHQYSDTQAAFVIDNTRSQPIIRLRNASNAVLSPGTEGSGDYLDLWGFDGPGNLVQLGTFDKNLKWRAKNLNNPFTFQPDVAVIALQVVQAQDAKGLYVNKSGTGVFAAADIVQGSPAAALNVTQNAANHGIVHTQAAGGTGFYGLLVNGYTHAGKVAASQDGGITWTIQKDGVGAGTVLQIVNKGTGSGITVTDGSATRMIVDSLGRITNLNGANVTVTAGTGSPEGVVTAPVGSVYYRTDGGSGTTLYVKESGVSNIGWVAPGAAPDVQTFTTANNGSGANVWAKPAGAKTVEFLIVGGGGGGGSGRKGLDGTVRCGGGGGAGGARGFYRIPASSVPSSLTVVAGAGGAGGLAQTNDSNDGLPGVVGAASTLAGTSFSLSTGATNLGSGGTATTGAGAFAPTTQSGGASGAGTAASTTGLVGATGGGGGGGAGGGGSGGGLTTGNANSAGGAGGNVIATAYIAGGTAGSTGGGGGGAGNASTTVTPAGFAIGGSGGGGGGSKVTASAAGDGGAGGFPGGGGGGGGAGKDATSSSGAGGAGANGTVTIVTYF